MKDDYKKVRMWINSNIDSDFVRHVESILKLMSDKRLYEIYDLTHHKSLSNYEISNKLNIDLRQVNRLKREIYGIFEMSLLMNNEFDV